MVAVREEERRKRKRRGSKDGGIKGGLMSAVLIWTCD